jgi:prepilin-type N-terminal cleavage/methylation domain-containing protein
MINKENKYGFTLIELLIVVAIIGILSSIATANFLSASVRAKTARTRADMAAITTGLELYQVDNNHYPTYHYTSYEYRGKFNTEFFMGGYITNMLVPHPFDGRQPLTSPIPYLSSLPKDPFHLPESDDPPDTWSYVYTNWIYANKKIPVSGFAEAFHNYGAWRLNGAGPDRDRLDIKLLYDPTNGIASNGDIYRTHKSPLGIPQE